MTPDELSRIGEKLFGLRWQTKLAEVLPVSTRSISYWLSGEREMREVVARRIESLEAEFDRATASPRSSRPRP